jgi:hypothetical protein
MGKGEEERGAPAAGETRRWGFPESGAAAQTSDCDQSQADRDPPTSDYAAAYNEQVPGSASTHTDSSSPALLTMVWGISAENLAKGVWAWFHHLTRWTRFWSAPQRQFGRRDGRAAVGGESKGRGAVPASVWNCQLASWCRSANVITSGREAMNRRVLVIDDNESIHDDFRKVLMPTSAADDDLLAAEAELFGEPVSVVDRVTFELAFASQGQQGHQLVKGRGRSGAALRDGLCGHAHAARLGRAGDHCAHLGGLPGYRDGDLHGLQ